MAKKKKTVAVIGATGVVGSEIVRLLKERAFPYEKLLLFNRSNPISLDGVDLAFFAAGSSISKEWIPKAKCICIDSSSAFRDTHPLIIPEINPHAIKGSILTSPNCAATILLMPLFRLHRKFRIKRIVLSTYQAASGGGAKLMRQLLEETRSYLEDDSKQISYAFNLFPHNSFLHENGYVEEEIKIRDETQKILEDESLQVTATSVRVPVLRAHSISANVEFNQSFTMEDVYKTIQNTPGVKIYEDRAHNQFPTPVMATRKNDVFCGRFRIDPTQPNTLELWIVGDQLLKGAALNAVQIAELTD